MAGELISKINNGMAVRPSGLVSEIVMAAGRVEFNIITELVNQITVK